MIYLDTNILIRIITRDVAELADRATAVISNGTTAGFCILDAVLVEVCFILEHRGYAKPRDEIILALETILRAPQIYVTNTTRSALEIYKASHKLDYVDCLLAALGEDAEVFTFDKDLQKALA